MRTALEINASFEKSMSKNVGVWGSPNNFFFFFSFICVSFQIFGVFFAEKMIKLLKCYCNSLIHYVQPR